MPISELIVNNPYVFKNLRFVKLGRWATYPADVELWHTEHTSNYFEEYFGIWKEILAICVFDKEYSNHMYVPESFVKQLHSFIANVTAHDRRGLEKILMKFYDEKELIKKEASQTYPKNVSALDNNKLAEVYIHNRDLAHRIVVYDQFTWIAENYWIPLMDEILVQKLGLKKDSPEYSQALFALTKPQNISTTLEEKRAVIELALQIKKGLKEKVQAAQQLAAQYGWMPVLAYGLPWDEKKYVQELEGPCNRDIASLTKELTLLQDYTTVRNRDLEVIVGKYGISSNDLQIFIDFGLAIDTRNEAEYVASFVGFYLLPLYDEMIKRLQLSITDLRTLCADEIVACLRGEANPQEILARKGRICAWLLYGKTKQRINFTPEQGEEVFAFAEGQQSVRLDNPVDPSVARRGITASRGKAQGRVKLVPSPDENYKVEEGDILFAYSTMVDNLPAMKKAAAFVTESGGLTCHAAVVAREFGVPCIVGLKNAMSLFKEGDMVEVDADNGMVRKL
ncbi:MAG TPA: PEP-utilizing enzyme [Patescibacteria group bacterium]|nr:PEP-utilizing enzyme [Patescibacteria group bacterium]